MTVCIEKPYPQQEIIRLQGRFRIMTLC